MKVAVYARVSTVNGGQKPETQLMALREYCQQRGWEVVEEYVDHISGAKESRPALNRLMADAKRRKFKAVVVWKLDRFGRSLRHLVNSLAEFDALGVSFVSMTDAIDMTTPQGRLMFNIIGSMAEFERGLIRERVKVGMKRAKEQGTRSGLPIGRAGSDVTLEDVQRHQAKGESVSQIAEALQVSRALIYKRLKGK